MSDKRWIVDQADASARLDKFLAAEGRLSSRGRASEALARGKIFINDEEATRADAARRLASGDNIRFWDDRPGSSRRRAPRSARKGELSIVFEDDALIVVDKPAGLLAVPLERREDATSVKDELVDYFRANGKRKPFVVHRIDRDTSGLVVFAVTASAQARLRDQFRRREPERVYLAVVYGQPSPVSGTWRDHLTWDERSLVQKETHPRDPRAQEAVCHYRVLEKLNGSSVIEVRLVTGRRNQIRLQARLHGHTLVGESRYTYGPDALRPIPFTRQALHAYRLGFQHPSTGKDLAFESPLPTDMKDLIEKLRGTAKTGNPFSGGPSLKD